MKEWRFKRGMVAAALVYVLAGSTARAEQGAPPGELEALKRMVQEVMSQNEELRRRVRDLEAAMTRRGQAPEEAAKQAEAPKEPAKPIATEPAKEPIKAWILGSLCDASSGAIASPTAIPNCDMV